ncbi:MAG: hypothetical protein A3J74_00230 [Elusimicrobia bacterium RIFCSPHIGHO2_02_FULL_57_9]|nr:MAG: hypothetical protein A3J74_00230 [Elusimicrobia bacterium RIFCSPHIGHO2_02_FULL_57_9]
MATLNEKALRSLVGLLDDEDPRSLDLVKNHILNVGEPIIPFLEELRAKSGAEIAAKADAITRELRFMDLNDKFSALAKVIDPDLEKGVLLLARFGYPGIDTRIYSNWLDQVAAKIESDLPQKSTETVVFQRLNSYLFQALGFVGNEARYYDPDNSYLNRVIDSRRGIPVSLSVIYLLLAKRLRLPAHGVATPGHFLVSFRTGSRSCFVDAYHRGRLMDLSDIRRMLLRSGYEFRPEFLSRSTSRDIIVRMMRNLISIYEKMSCPDRAEMLSSLVEVMLTRGRPPSAK